MRAQLSTRDYENLSAYLDGQLSSGEKARLEERMETNTELRSVYDEMSRTRALLRAAPRHRAPRNFTLTAAMVQARKPGARSFLDFFPVLSFASGIATLALVLSFMLGPGVVPGRPVAEQAAPAVQELAVQKLEADQSEQKVALPTLEAAAMPEAEEPLQAQKAAAPAQEASVAQAQNGPVITWGFPPSPEEILANKGGGGWGGSIPNYGRGGGDGNPEMESGASVFMDGNLVVPQASVEGLGQEKAGIEAAPSAPLEAGKEIPLITGSGPILGVPVEGQGGQYLNPIPVEDLGEQPPTALEGRSPEPELVEETASQQPLGLPALQIILAAFAVSTGAAAGWMWLKNRRAGW